MEQNINTNTNSKHNTCIKNEIKYISKMTCLKYNNKYNLLCVGDETGKISIFDMRINKAVKLIKSDKTNTPDIKYI